MQSYGFASFSGASLVRIFVCQLPYLRDAWAMSLFPCCQIFQVGFVKMSHSREAASLDYSGVSSQRAAPMVRGLLVLQGIITLPGARATAKIVCSERMKQGGVATLAEWIASVNYLLEPVVALWRARGLGFQVGQLSTNYLVMSYAIRADNIIVFSSTHAMLTTVLTELAQAMNEGTLLWKSPSLEILAVSRGDHPLQLLAI